MNQLIGHVERIELGAGFAYLSGWVAFRDKTAVHGPVTISIPDCGSVVIPNLLHRRDLQAAGIADGNAAFHITLPLSSTPEASPKVIASIDGAQPINLVSNATARVPFAPRGSLDRTVGGSFAGWVFDPAIRISNVPVRLIIDDTLETPLRSNVSRPDIPYGADVFGFAVGYDDILASAPDDRNEGFPFDNQHHTVKVVSGTENVTSVTVQLKWSKPKSLGSRMTSSTTSLASAPTPTVTKDNQPHREKVLELHRRADQSSIVEQKEADTSKEDHAPARRQPVGSAGLTARVEKVFHDGKALLISGWASRADNAAIAGPIQLELVGVECDAIEIGSLDFRGDVKSKDIADGYAGYMALFELADGRSLPQALRLTSVDTQDSVTIAISPQAAIPRPHFINLKSTDDNRIWGTCLKLEPTGRPKDVNLRVMGKFTLTVPLVEETENARVWNAQGVSRCNFTLTRKELIARLRGLHPTIAIERNTKCEIELLLDGHPAATCNIALAKPVKGRIEIAQADRVSGWLVPATKTSNMAEFDVYVDGVRYTTVTAGQGREDLVRKGLTTRGGGFRFEAPNPKGNDTQVEIAVAQALTRDFIEGSGKVLDVAPAKHASLDSLFANLTKAKARGVSVIIPVYNAADDLILCLESLLRNTTVPCRLIIINDCSPDPRINEILAGYEAISNVQIYQNEVNLGFTKTVNRGIELADEDDVVFLNSDTIVTPGWLQGMRAAAYSDLRIATVTATSNNAGAFNVPEMGVDNSFPPGFSIDDFARLVRRASIVSYPRVPTGNGFCLYVRRDTIDAIGPLDQDAFPVGYGEENDFCMRALRTGWQHIIDDRTYVFHKRSASFGETKGAHYAAGRAVIETRYPEYKKLTPVFENSPEILGMRWRVRKAVAELGTNPNVPRPRYAFVISTQTGGTPQTNRDLMASLADRYEPWVLRCDSKAVEIYRYDSEGDVLVERVAFSNKIEPALHTSAEYNDVMASMLVRYGFELVHIRHLGWHGVDLPLVCRTLGIPVVFSLHDFYVTCPTIKLIDENRKYCGGTCTATAGDCAVELWSPSQFPPLKHNFINRWREIFSQTFESCDAFVTTAESAKSIFTTVYPQLSNADFRVIPHGRSFDQVSLESEEPDVQGPLRVLVPGNISVAKGADLIKEVVDMDVDRRIEFHILGDAGKLQTREGLTVHGRYKREEFNTLVKQIRPNVGAVLSIWPETYCHTLTEMWSAGVPVIGIDCGAVGERIKSHGGGWLLPLGSSAKELYQLLLNIRHDTLGHRACVDQVSAWQSGYNLVHTVDYMGVQYDVLYRQTTHQKRAFQRRNGDASRCARVAVVHAGPKCSSSAFVNSADKQVVYWSLGSDWPLLKDESIEYDAVIVDATDMAPHVESTIKHIADGRGASITILKAPALESLDRHPSDSIESLNHEGRVLA